MSEIRAGQGMDAYRLGRGEFGEALAGSWPCHDCGKPARQAKLCTSCLGKLFAEVPRELPGSSRFPGEIRGQENTDILRGAAAVSTEGNKDTAQPSTDRAAPRGVEDKAVPDVEAGRISDATASRSSRDGSNKPSLEDAARHVSEILKALQRPANQGIYLTDLSAYALEVHALEISKALHFYRVNGGSS